jgi:hypothetical protein
MAQVSLLSATLCIHGLVAVGRKRGSAKAPCRIAGLRFEVAGLRAHSLDWAMLAVNTYGIGI